MKIDVTKILINQINSLHINSQVEVPSEYFANSLIDNLTNIMFNGSVTLNEDNELVITGIITGVMTLKDDITLEPVDYNFSTELEEILPKNQNILDITDILWQNILVEIPSKVRNTDEDIEINGNGWRVISEEKYNEERNKANNPFSNLDELLKKEDK